MPFIFTHTVLVLVLLIGAEVQAQQSKTTEPLNVMAFNIRYASATGANAWPKRRGGVVKVIADQKADHIGTQHHPYTFTLQEGLDAVAEVVHHLETYDVTTIRAATPMFLMSRKIKAMGVKMVLSGVPC